MQTWIVALLVVGCFVYAAWKLMPAVARRALASTLLKLPLPNAIGAKLSRAATASPGCGCDGCDSATPKSAPKATQVVTFHPRQPR
ncbi:MAG: hypothetical protein H7Y61_04455 [Rhizobiales bacterium]|nr:hypothetical protein [Rhizobacter sp.]